MLADELRLLGGAFPATRLKLRPGTQALEVAVDGPGLAGSLTVPEAKGAAVQGRFTRLHWQPPPAAAAAQPENDATAVADAERSLAGAKERGRRTGR